MRYKNSGFHLKQVKFKNLIFQHNKKSNITKGLSNIKLWLVTLNYYK